MQRFPPGKRRWLKNAMLAFSVLFFVIWASGVVADPLPLRLMRSKLEKLRWKAESLSLKDAGYTANLFYKSAYADFEIQDQPPKTVYIEMEKDPIFLPWHVSQYRVNE
jgi:hypothetical protein